MARTNSKLGLLLLCCLMFGMVVKCGQAVEKKTPLMPATVVEQMEITCLNHLFMFMVVC